MKIVIKKGVAAVLLVFSLQGSTGVVNAVDFKGVFAKICTKTNLVRAGIGIGALLFAWKLHGYGNDKVGNGILGAVSAIESTPENDTIVDKKVLQAAVGSSLYAGLNLLMPADSLKTELSKKLGYDSHPDEIEGQNKNLPIVLCSHGFYSSKEYLSKKALQKKYGKVNDLKDLGIEGLKNQFVGFDYPDAGDSTFRRVVNLSRSFIGSEDEALYALHHLIECAKKTNKVVLFGHSRGGSPIVHMLHMLVFPEQYAVETWHGLGFTKKVNKDEAKKLKPQQKHRVQGKTYVCDTEKITGLLQKIDRVFLVNPLLDLARVQSFGKSGGLWNWFSKMFVTLATRTTLPSQTPYEKLTAILNKKNSNLKDNFVTVHFSEQDCMLGNPYDKEMEEKAKDNKALSVKIHKDRGTKGHYWLRHGLEDLCGYLEEANNKVLN